jgi:hypothetical protein
VAGLALGTAYLASQQVQSRISSLPPNSFPNPQGIPLDPELDIPNRTETIPQGNVEPQIYTFPNDPKLDKSTLTDGGFCPVGDLFKPFFDSSLYGPAYPHAGTVENIPFLGGKTFTQADNIIKSNPDLKSSTTSSSGQYKTYKFQDGSRIDIRTTDGRVTREPAPLYNSEGKRVNKGWRYKIGEGPIPTRDSNGQPIPGAHGSNEIVK